MSAKVPHSNHDSGNRGIYLMLLFSPLLCLMGQFFYILNVLNTCLGWDAYKSVSTWWLPTLDYSVGAALYGLTAWMVPLLVASPLSASPDGLQQSAKGEKRQETVITAGMIGALVVWIVGVVVSFGVVLPFLFGPPDGTGMVKASNAYGHIVDLLKALGVGEAIAPVAGLATIVVVGIATIVCCIRMSRQIQLVIALLRGSRE